MRRIFLQAQDRPYSPSSRESNPSLTPSVVRSALARTSCFSARSVRAYRDVVTKRILTAKMELVRASLENIATRQQGTT